MRAAAPLLAVLALAGCGGENRPEQADEFARRVFELVVDGEAGAAWDELHPEHRQAVPRDLYVRCEGDEGLPAVHDIRVERVNREPALLPGVGRRSSTEVVFSYLYAGSPALLDMHVFDVDGTWAWVIGANDYAAYAAGRCP